MIGCMSITLPGFNYTTYDVRRAQDVINPRTPHHNVMVVCSNLDMECQDHKYIYSRVWVVYHINVIITDAQWSTILQSEWEFLWIHWYKPLDQRSDWSTSTLDRVNFPPLTDEHSFDFLDPADVLRGCHIVPRFTAGRRHKDGLGVSACAGDKNDWCEYYINRSRHAHALSLGLGVGHVYSHCRATQAGLQQSDTPSHPFLTDIEEPADNMEVDEFEYEDEGTENGLDIEESLSSSDELLLEQFDEIQYIKDQSWPGLAVPFNGLVAATVQGGITGRSERFHFTGYLAIPPRPVLYPLYCVSNQLDALKLEITLLDYLVSSIKDHDPAYEPGQQGKEVPIYIDRRVSGVTLDWDIAWYKQGPDKIHRVYQWPQDDTDNGGNYNTLAHSADYPMGHVPVCASASSFRSAPLSRLLSIPLLVSSPCLTIAMWIEVGVTTQEMAGNTFAMAEPLTSCEQPSVMPGVYLSAPQSPVGSSVNLYSPIDSVPESWMMSSAKDASSIQVGNDASQPDVPKAVSYADTLHTILPGFPQWKQTLVCLRLKMKLALCPMTGITVITTNEMLALVSKLLTGFTSEVKHMAKLAILDTRPMFGFGLHDSAAADPSLLANKCVEFLRCFMFPHFVLLPISANGLMWLLKHEIVKSLVYYLIFCASSTSGARVVIGDEEPAIFRTAALPPVETVVFVLVTWYSALFTRLTELVKQLLGLLGETNDPGYPDLLQVLVRLFSASASFTPSTRHFLEIEHTKHALKSWLQNQGDEIVPDPLFTTTSVLFGWVDPLDLIAVLQMQLIQKAGEDLVTPPVTQPADVDLLPANCDYFELSTATHKKCEAWLATSWQFEVDFPQAHEVPELYEHLSMHDNYFLSPLMEAWFGRVTHCTYITTSSAEYKPLRTDNTESFKAKKNKTPDALKSDFSILESKKQHAQAEVDMFSEVIACTAGFQYSDDGTCTSSGTAGTFESRLPVNSSKWFDYWFEDWCSTSSVSSDASALF
ncbi:uncharacterized protein F5147DRAFT_780001 [Suillus discolor]|uniref:Uncharacterized protein n=1 Tax=Suillus discolor TaxID=1912936 RepID=A0A9P7EVB8_9AGAM|nr:uncharacterized protein F5147DRAFT_780001 [Suillus discolor]KAG2091316.1 hypothetical protein F5147DRAFT_780001 [Suillus discolor]